MLIEMVATWLLAAPVDPLSHVTVEGMKLKVPSAWSLSVNQGTYHYGSSAEDGAFELSIYPVTPRDGQQCLDELLVALGGEKDWKRLSVGGAPAARRVFSDRSQAKEKAFATRTYLGCNGHYKWVLTFSLQQSKKQRYEPLAEAVVKSIQYPKNRGDLSAYTLTP
jgi:hypothetical protein